MGMCELWDYPIRWGWTTRKTTARLAFLEELVFAWLLLNGLPSVLAAWGHL